MSRHPSDDTAADLYQVRWPGLAAYGEADYTLFYGRSTESEGLLRCVERETLTVVFGPSGVGKTSLLNAGLFPLLRDKHYLPVRLRIDYSGQIPIIQQVKNQLTSLCQANDLEIESAAPPVLSAEAESLWESVHRQRFWDDRNWPIIPVLIFDQFEEIFTIGKNSRDAQNFLTELSDLVENHIPLKLRQHLDSSHVKLNFSYQQQHYKVVLTLREDFVARLDGLRPQMPSVMHNRFYLGRMNGKQALSAVVGPGQDLVTAETADKIIRFVGDWRENHVDLQKLEIEPALLSVVCRELNLRRIKEGYVTISSGLLSGSQEAILEDFYERSIRDLQPDVRIFIEDDLLTSSGYRDSMAVEDVLHKYDIDAASFGQLVDRRLLRMERSLRVDRVELIHDLLTGVVQQSRDKRQELEVQAKERRRAAELQNKLRRSRMIILAFATIAIVAVYFMVVAIKSKNEITKNTDKLFYNDLIRKARLMASEKPRLSLLLIMEAIAKFRDEAGPSTISAEESFREIIAKVSGTALTWSMGQSSNTVSASINEIAVSKNGKWLAAANGQGQCLIWNIGSPNGYIEPIVIKGHREKIFDIKFHPNSRWLATTGRDQTIRLWDLTSAQPGNQPIELRGHGAAIYSIEFSPQGRWLASAGGDKSVRLWDIQDPRNPKPSYAYTEFNNLVNHVTFSSDGRWLAAGSLDNSVLLWELSRPDYKSNKIRLMPIQQPVSSVAFSPDNNWLTIFYDDGRIGLWDLSGLYFQGEQDIQTDMTRPPSNTIHTVHPSGKVAHYLLKGHASRISSHAFQSSGPWLATAARDRRVLLWDLSKPGPEIEPVELAGEVQPEAAVAFHPSGRWLASGGSNHSVVLWEMNSNKIKIQHVFHGFEGGVSALRFSRNGSILAAASSDQTIRYWNFSGPTPTFEPIALLGHAAGISALKFSDDGNTLFSGNRNGTARIWDLSAPYFFSEPTVLKGHRGAVTALATDYASGIFVTAGPDDPPRLWNLSRSYRAWPPENRATQMQDLVAGFASRDRTRLLFRGSEQKTWLVDVQNWGAAQIAYPLHDEDFQIRNTFSSRDLNWLAVAGWSSELYLRHIDDRRAVSNWIRLKGHRNIGDKAIFSPDARWLMTLDLNDEALLWHLEDVQSYPNPFAVSADGNPQRLRLQIFSPDGRWLITATHSGKTALWALSADRPVHRPLALSKAQSQLAAAAFSPQGNKLVTAHEDFGIHIWHVDSDGSVRHDRRLTRLPAAATQLQFSPSGRVLTTALDDGRLHLRPIQASSGSGFYLPASKTDRLANIEFSGDEKWLLVQHAGNPVQLYRNPVTCELEAGSLKPALTVESRQRLGVFSPDSRWLATIHLNGDLFLTELAGETTPVGCEVPTLRPHLLRPSSSQMIAAIFDQKARHLITADRDGVLHRWDLGQKAPWSTAEAIPGKFDRKATMAFLPGEQRLAIEDESAVQTYDLSPDGSQNRYPMVARFEHHKNSLPGRLFDDQSYSIVAGVKNYFAGWLQFLFAPQKQALEELEADRGTGGAESAPEGDRQLSEDSSLEAEWVDDYFVNVLRKYQDKDNHIYWTNDGRRAARLLKKRQEIVVYAKSESGRFHPLGRLKYEQADNVASIALSPKGRYLALGYATGKVGSLDLGRPITKENIVLLGRHARPQAINAIVFSPNGRWLASGSQDSSIIIWPVDMDSLFDGACHTVGRSMTPQERMTFMQDKPSRVSCTE